ncbi:MAG: M48 family metallopeptidase [Alphaproteobacteria bacterium]|nr:M48 family metallopeptidase [Alphaproteobacteria bacterium]
MRHPGLFRGLRHGLTALAAAGLVLSPVSAALAQDDDQISIIRDTEIERTLHEEMDPIFVAAGLDPKAVRINLVSSREVQAFAAGGQQIFVYSGLILQATTPNELIGVLAHETGHIAGAHLARAGDMEHAAIGTMLVSVGLGILTALAGAPSAGASLIFSSGFFGELNALGYSREQESRADQAAATYLERAGVSGRGLVAFMNYFRYQEVFDDSKKYPYFRSHPLSDDRIEALAVRVKQQPHYDQIDSPHAIAAFEVMKAKLEGFIDGAGQVAEDYPDSDQSFPARYARAISLYRQIEPDAALKAVDGLLAEQPNNPYLWELEGQIDFDSGRTRAAEIAHGRSVEIDPDAPLLRINHAQALVALGDPASLDAAILDLRRSLAAEPDSPLAWRLLSEAYDGKNDPGMARLAAAEQNFYLGQLLEARTFAFNARKLFEKGTPQWRRATDIILASKPTPEQLKALGGG